MGNKDSKPADIKPAGAKDEIEGEGSYTAARNYDEKTEKFVADHKSDIPKMAHDAEDALDGPEGEELKQAEEEGKAKARH